MNTLKYHQDYYEFRGHKQTEKVLKWCYQRSTILEFGCHTGLLSNLLFQQGSIVTGIDLNSEALEFAKPYQKVSVLANLNEIDEWIKVLGNNLFDVILFLHVLEHLHEPQLVLKSALNLLTHNGIIIIGLPNVSDAKDRFDMFFGKFEYTEIGVMDHTHISMFNYYSAKKLIEENGLIIEEYYSPMQVNPIKHFFDHLPILWRIGKTLKDKPGFFFKNRPNITDSVMLFRCKKK